ncbi:RNA polymerase subunit sigma [Cryobacterium lactosi]|uniref:RNA polymerase subunit sigma n=1 Tax=Cryobacterium lactosi TaxID=1259202 RepID=A0A4V3IWZ7_9MICO|nr:sigma factor [Cryobacterium lactosi]TFD88104.1 RNA polymerase subunit sigma [Cryobacterium lactosi]
MATPAPDLPANEVLFPDERQQDASSEQEAAAPAPGSDLRQRERWLASASQGDTGAFAELYDDVAPQVHGLVLRILRDVREAEALTQRVFAEIWRSSARFDSGQGAALSWMITLAHRMCVEHVRGNPDRGTAARSAPGRHAIAQGGPDVVPVSPGSVPDPVPYGTALGGALADLEPTQRHALKLAYFNAHSHDEVSQILRIPPGAAKACLTRGLYGLGRSLSEATS